jgi:hypothetical protein
LLLYVGLVASLLSAIAAFFVVSLEARVKNQTVGEVEESGAAALARITQTLHNARSITTPATSTASTTLTLVTFTTSTNPTVFDLASGTLRIKEGTSTAVALTPHTVTISNLLFQNLSRTSTPGIVRAQFRVTAVNSIGRNEYDDTADFIGSGSLRNK